MKVNELLVRHLESEGVRYIFGVPGAPLMPIYHAMSRPGSRIRPIIAKHEEGGAFMADGYARVSGGIGVCCGTAGPGTTNLITGVASSFRESIPVLVLTAQAPLSSFGKGAAQECMGEGRSFSSAELLRPLTKSSTMVVSADTLSFTLRQALRSAMHPRMGPVHLNLPVDILRREIGNPEVLLPSFKLTAAYFDRDRGKEATKALLRARKPVFFLGRGAILSGACDTIRSLAEQLCIPVVTTPKAKGAFPEDHPLSLGVFGLAGSRAAATYLLKTAGVDLLFAVGTSFDEWGTNGWDPHLKGEKLLIHLDIDSSQIGKNYPANIGLIGDAGTILRELQFELDRGIRKIDFVLTRTVGSIQHHKRAQETGDPEKEESAATPIKPQRLIRDLREVVPSNGIFFVDSGNHLLWAIHQLKVFEPGTFIIALNLGAMGYAIAAAVGGKLAAPDRPVIALCGDGCFFMHGMEVATAVNYGIPVIWVVFNDGRLNMIYQGESLQHLPGVEEYAFRPTNFAMMAEGMGALGIRVKSPKEIKPALRRALESGRPTVVDVLIDPDELSPIKERVRAVQKYLNP